MAAVNSLAVARHGLAVVEVCVLGVTAHRPYGVIQRRGRPCAALRLRVHGRQRRVAAARTEIRTGFGLTRRNGVPSLSTRSSSRTRCHPGTRLLFACGVRRGCGEGLCTRLTNLTGDAEQVVGRDDVNERLQSRALLRLRIFVTDIWNERFMEDILVFDVELAVRQTHPPETTPRSE